METTTALPESVRLASPPGIGAAVRRLLRARWAEAWCALVLAVMAINLLLILPQKTITVDEFVHIPAGYVGLTQGDFRPNNEHPPLAKLWAAVPLLTLGTKSPPDLPAENPGQRTMNIARYFWEENAAKFSAITFWARVPMIALTLALGVVVFVATRRNFGPRAGVLAVALFSLEPTILGHGRIVHTDIAAALAYLVTWLALSAYAARPTWSRAALLGLATGAAFATKYSLVVLGPVVALGLLALLVSAPRRGQARRAIMGQIAVVALVALVALNAAYEFRHQPLEEIDLAWIRAEHPADAGRVIAGVDALAPVVPPYYLLGVYTVFGHNEGGHQAALFDEHSQHGWWYYFPVAFALKTAIPFLLIALGALGWALWRIGARRDWRLLAFVGPPALYAGFAMTSQINIGIRHILPVFPFLFILGGAALDRLLAARIAIPRMFRARKGRWRTNAKGAPLRQSLGVAIVALLLGWMGVEAVRAHPDYLVYLNELARGPGWQYLSDSNVEWGDDTEALAAYLHAQGEQAVRAAVAGSRDSLGFFGVEYLDYFDTKASDPPTRYLAIGASFLNGSTVPPTLTETRPDYFATYRYRQPVAVFGRAIYLYPYPETEAPLAAALSPTTYRATLAASRLPTALHPGETVGVWVQVRNDSTQAWPPSDRGEVRYQIRLGNRWFDASGATLVRDDARAPLYHALYPGDLTDMLLAITAPDQPGDYLLDIDLAQEGIAWFGEQGSAPIRVVVRVR